MEQMSNLNSDMYGHMQCGFHSDLCGDMLCYNAMHQLYYFIVIVISLTNGIKYQNGCRRKKIQKRSVF